ncbi:MAG: DUF3365 domain-containing protein [Thermomonas sp.]|uniref:Tll0287-like domain-containing protein n=1 Tax=Thermomonas sp. TaxID=1971895 RepID=UPI001B4CC7D9|nr:DUF3365 domain-containing protein [Thermomonas sp.]MBK6416652.1 DUF3365 domain-containing protein [Thermomonas sp.]MBK9670007.1 DUF3365 domain-containing protein [Thermomonas sp.]MBP7788687.1 DUF3365 domain-containing protein [Thermomonas sp.]MBP8647775.1 DUF3365 domain-containing protein [Thermomonas sp.]HQW60390.1 DUF3365 domain-containing protein [Thermomonas sp.]
MIRTTLCLPPLLAVLLAACSSAPPPQPAAAVAVPAAPAPVEAPAPTAPQVRAQAAAKAFSSSLKQALGAELAKGGTTGAITFCHAQAPKIAAQVAAEHGVRIGRVPVPGRQRSPANAPDAWQADALRALIARHDAGTPVAELVQVVDSGLPDGVALRMMRGIPVEPACLACHGKALADDTRAALERLYPGDTATGFDAGDLRGALWVEVPALD